MSEKKKTMSDLSNIAIIGSGPTSLYLFQHIWNNIEVFKDTIKKITIFEKQETVGMGMPYSPHNTVHLHSRIRIEVIKDCLFSFIAGN